MKELSPWRTRRARETRRAGQRLGGGKLLAQRQDIGEFHPLCEQASIIQEEEPGKADGPLWPRAHNRHPCPQYACSRV